MNSKISHSAESLDEELIIALDFGTTFSGVAYAFSNSSKSDVFSVLDWPGLEGHQQPKTPTVISYDPEDNSSFAWGAQRHQNPRMEGIKLLLDPGQEMPVYVPASNTAAQLRRLGKPAVEVAADYMSAIYMHAMSKIESKMQVDYLRMCRKKFVVSVPAVWSDKAKDTTIKAAYSAGIYPITLIKEPEAAALYTFHVFQGKALAVGDAFVICDAGGGTVDLISYEITALSPKLELKELVGGKGEMAGSLGLNKRFEQAVQDIMGEDQFFYLRQTKGFEEAKIQFDKSIKVSFRGGADEEYFVNFPMARLQDDPENNIQANCWNMKGDTLIRIFKPPIRDIQRLVDEQVNLVKVKRMSENHPKAQEIKAIFLVGGFGSSQYLKQCLESGHPGIQVIQPHDAWSAVPKGVVLSQLSHAAITSTIAVRHYGVPGIMPYDDNENHGQLKIQDEFSGEDYVNTVTWYIFEGDELKRDHKIIFSFSVSCWKDCSKDDMIFKVKLIQCEAKQPPNYPDDSTKIDCTLTTNMTGIDCSLLKEYSSPNGSIYYKLPLDLAVTLQAASAVMKFSSEVDGKETGSVEASYE